MTPNDFFRWKTNSVVKTPKEIDQMMLSGALVIKLLEEYRDREFNKKPILICRMDIGVDAGLTPKRMRDDILRESEVKGYKDLLCIVIHKKDQHQPEFELKTFDNVDNLSKEELIKVINKER